jgi:aldehyde:ferredoxin oxidoreductase
MFPYSGYVGKYLRVNLTESKVSILPLPVEWVEQYLGGNGIGTKILWDEVGLEVEPLSPENKLIISTGPICGTLMPNSSRVAVVTKSPLTGIYGDANAGGFFGPELKFAGFDLVVLEGKAPKPAYLWIKNQEVEIRDASHLWGQDTVQTEEILKKELGDQEIKLATIGPAGENLVKYAAINMTPQRTAARSGVGAVMGSKNLKAVAVRGRGPVPIAEPDRFYQVSLKSHLAIRNNQIFPVVSRYGTPGIVTLMNKMGRFPTKNFQMGAFPKADDIGAEALREKHFVKDIGCFCCPIACDKIYAIKEGEFAGTVVRSLEYETLNTLGAGVWNDNLNSIIKGNDLCDRLGLDTISAGRAISFAMELYEEGIISASDLDGIELSWGNYQGVLTLLEKIAYRQGVGNLLAEGVRRAAAKIGNGAEYYAMEVKGQEISAQDGRAQQSMGLAHITSNRGADHLKAFPTIDETGHPAEGERRYGKKYLPEIVDPLAIKHKPFLVKDGEDYGAVIDSSGNCKSGGTFVLAEIYWQDMAEAISSATGIEFSIDRLKEIGERIYNLQRSYNVLHGISRKDDRLPERLLKEANPSGNAKGQVARVEEMLPLYYEMRGWDKETGYPSKEKLIQLGLHDVLIKLDETKLK